MLHHGPNPNPETPLDVLNAHLASHGNQLALTFSQHQNQLNVSLHTPEKAFGSFWFWFSLSLLGIALLPLELYFTTTVTIEVGLLGFVLLSASIVGFSTHLSAYLNDSRYNLLTSLKFFMARHKLLTVIAAASLLMFDPLSLIIGLSIGVFIDIALYGFLNLIEVQSRRFFDWVVNTLTLDNAENLMRYCMRHPLNLLSMIAGATGALTLFTRFFPQIFPFLFNVLRASFNAIENIVNDVTSPITRGYIPYYILTGFAWLACVATLPLTLFALPTIGMAGGSWLGLKIWETTYSVLSFCGKKSYEFFKPLLQRRQAMPAAQQGNAPPAPAAEAVPPVAEEAIEPDVSEESVEIVMEVPRRNARRERHDQEPPPRTEYVLRLRPRRSHVDGNREGRRDRPEERREDRASERREERRQAKVENRRRERGDAENAPALREPHKRHKIGH